MCASLHIHGFRHQRNPQALHSVISVVAFLAFVVVIVVVLALLVLASALLALLDCVALCLVFMSTILDNASSSPWSSPPSSSRRQSRYVFEQTFFFSFYTCGDNANIVTAFTLHLRVFVVLINILLLVVIVVVVLVYDSMRDLL